MSKKKDKDNLEEVKENDKDQSLKVNNEEYDINSLICSLCFNFMYKCVTTFCGHSFCEQCLDEYLILKKVRITYMHYIIL